MKLVDKPKDTFFKTRPSIKRAKAPRRERIAEIILAHFGEHFDRKTAVRLSVACGIAIAKELQGKKYG